MSAAEHERWEKVRASGRVRYVLAQWTLGWGLTHGVLFSALIGWLLPSAAPEATFLERTWQLAPSLVPLYLVAGFVFGLRKWRRNERRFLASPVHVEGEIFE